MGTELEEAQAELYSLRQGLEVILEWYRSLPVRKQRSMLTFYEIGLVFDCYKKYASADKVATFKEAVFEACRIRNLDSQSKKEWAHFDEIMLKL